MRLIKPDECDYQSERHCSKTIVTDASCTLSAITSQNGTAPKRRRNRGGLRDSAITSQNGTAPKRCWYSVVVLAVRLPVRTALLQNIRMKSQYCMRCDYQSERHCSKTCELAPPQSTMCDYQSERHCSKTISESNALEVVCDYQSERHCSKTVRVHGYETS